jgi:hypothetical protein
MKKRIELSILIGFGITLSLSLLSRLAIRFFPYHDKPMMPKPFFLYALSPGLMVGELYAQYGWVSEALFFLVNAIAYSLITILVMASIRKLVTMNEHPS